MALWAKNNWGKVFSASLPVLVGAFVIIPPFIGLPERVDVVEDKVIVLENKEVDAERDRKAMLCLQRLNFDTLPPTAEDVFDCGGW